MGDGRATVGMARQELDDLYLGLGVPDHSVDLPSGSGHHHHDGGDKEQHHVRGISSTTNIFACNLQQDHDDEQLLVSEAPPAPVGLRLSPTDVDQHRRRQNNRAPAGYKRRPGIPHSNVCALCSSYIYLFRHRCLVCGRVYCRRCVGTGMGDMAEGRKCIDCLGRRYSHRYIHRAGANLTPAATCCCNCFWAGGYHHYADAEAVKTRELVWAEKGPPPRRRPRPSSSSSSAASISTSTSYATSISMSINGRSSSRPVLAPASAPSYSYPNPHDLPL